VKKLSVLLISTMLTGCATFSNTQWGELAGAVTGAYVGSKFGGGSGQELATIAGAYIGMQVGGNIGSKYDPPPKPQVVYVEVNPYAECNRYRVVSEINSCIHRLKQQGR
jgi:surface antigen